MIRDANNLQIQLQVHYLMSKPAAVTSYIQCSCAILICK